MLLGRVVGEIWATQKDSRLERLKFLAVSPIDSNRETSAALVVAVDSVGAGPGELVLVAQGSSARQSDLTDGKPVDAVIMAIIDDFHVEKRDWQEFDSRQVNPEATS